jgi:hypothetical protein
VGRVRRAARRHAADLARGDRRRSARDRGRDAISPRGDHISPAGDPRRRGRRLERAPAGGW